ncbi:MAG TPA: hypothetical protein VFN30_00465 [Chitinophagaceae bacterium]|nr:hypothetical protein [Chitinophagaceae bacterium]
MKKLFVLTTAAFLFSGIAFAHGGGKKCSKKECKKEASNKSYCKKKSDKKC